MTSMPGRALGRAPLLIRANGAAGCRLRVMDCVIIFRTDANSTRAPGSIPTLSVENIPTTGILCMCEGYHHGSDPSRETPSILIEMQVVRA